MQGKILVKPIGNLFLLFQFYFKNLWFPGFLTTARVSHATPASLYAHSADRHWECNKPGIDTPLASEDITWQLVKQDPGRKAKVVMGGGLSSFLPADKSDSRSKKNKC